MEDELSENGLGFQSIEVALVFWYLDLGRRQQVASDPECERLVKKIGEEMNLEWLGSI